MSSVRFQLFIKAASESRNKLGDCPFSQRAYMFMLLKIKESDIQITPIDLSNKPTGKLKNYLILGNTHFSITHYPHHRIHGPQTYVRRQWLIVSVNLGYPFNVHA